ncbi:hypothetical protein HZA44_04730 [Candidatus Peregrinibacteria bacterium]|nr:hypothetical protein [Candidatus Peregrinibacteria bacterium]
MAVIKIDISGEVVEQSEDKPSEPLPEQDRTIREIPGLQIVEIVPTPDANEGFPPWRIPEILEIIEKNRGNIQKKSPDLPV